MAVNEKLLKALESAACHLEGAITAFEKREENSFADAIWHVAAELEYALFLFSLKLKDEDYDRAKMKPNPEALKIEAGKILEKIMELLDKARAGLKEGRLIEAYKNAYAARHYVFKIQEEQARKKREASRRK